MFWRTIFERNTKSNSVREQPKKLFKNNGAATSLGKTGYGVRSTPDREIRDERSRGDPKRNQAIQTKANTMKREYDISKAEQGKFYRKNAVLHLPIYLDAKVQAQVERLARKKGKDVGEVVNEVVQKEMELIEQLT